MNASKIDIVILTCYSVFVIGSAGLLGASMAKQYQCKCNPHKFIPPPHNSKCPNYLIQKEQ